MAAPVKELAQGPLDEIPAWKVLDDVKLDKFMDVHSLRPAEVSRLKRLPQLQEEVWMAIAAPVMGWQQRQPAVDPASLPPGVPMPRPDPTLIRPYCIFILSVSPVGRVLATVPCRQPPDAAPDSRTMLEVLMETMFHPPSGYNRLAPDAQPKGDEEGAARLRPHRPGRILFVDAGMATVCARSLADVGVPASLSRPYPYWEPVLKDFSESLLRKQVTRLFPQNNRMPLHALPGLKDAHLKGFWQLAAQFAAMKPWLSVADLHTLRVAWPTPCTMPGGEVVPPGAVYASLVGRQVITMRNSMMAAGVPPSQLPPLQVGITIFYRRHDAEGHFMSKQPKEKEGGGIGSNAAAGASGSSSAAGEDKKGGRPSAVPNPLDQVCSGCGRKGSEGADLSMCSGCRNARYCSAQCQKADRKAHADYCKENPANPGPDPQIAAQLAAQGPGAADRFFPLKQTLVLFEGPHMCSLGDLDSMRRLGCDMHANEAHPVPLTLRRGAPTAVTAVELLWICRAMAAVLAMMRGYPEEMTVPLPMRHEVTLDVRGQDRPGGNRSSTKERVEGVHVLEPASVGSKGRAPLPLPVPPVSAAPVSWHEAFEDVPLAHVRTDTILTQEQYKDIQEKVAKVAAKQVEYLKGEGAAQEGQEEEEGKGE